MTTRLLFIDTETGGLDAGTCSVLSVGLVVWDSGSITASSEIFIAEPQLHVDTDAQRIHGIDLTWLQSHGVPPSTAVEAIEAFLARYFTGTSGSLDPVPLAGHNVNFDISFLKRLYRLAEKDYASVFSHRTIDTAGILRFLNIAGALALEGAGSSAAFEYFGILFDKHGRHSALGDALATAQLFTKLIEVVKQRCRPSIDASADLAAVAGVTVK